MCTLSLGSIFYIRNLVFDRLWTKSSSEHIYMIFLSFFFFFFFFFHFVYRNKLQHFVDNQVLTKLVVSFSRDSTDSLSPRYVQDNLKLHADDVLDLLLEKGAVLYVCGWVFTFCLGILQTAILTENQPLKMHFFLTNFIYYVTVIENLQNKQNYF